MSEVLKNTKNINDAYRYEIENEICAISEILRRIRTRKGISHEQIAEETQLTQLEISEIENYKGNPTLSVLLQYCNCIGVDLHKAVLQELIGG